MRLLFGGTTASAAVALAILSTSIALIGWFAWIRRCLPRRIPSLLLAAVAAAAAFSATNLFNPSSDGVLLALTPLVLLAAARALRWDDAAASGEAATPLWWGIALLGLFAGSVCWIRYAAVFLPAALGVYLIGDAWLMRRTRWRTVLVYAVFAAAPLVAVLVINRVFGQGDTQSQLNLGSSVGFDLSWSVLAEAWTHFTEQTLYAHRREAFAFFVILLPVAVLGLPWLHRTARRRLSAFLRTPPVALSIAVTVVLLAELIAASVLFHDKYDYAAQPRYYQPIRPFYFLLFVGPLTLVAWRWVRAAICIPLVLAGMWFVRQDALRTIARWQAKAPVVTPYGRWAGHFAPGAPALFDWLAAQRGDDLVVFSNFHEEIALETGIPACPTPRDAAELDDWLERIAAVRSVQPTRILFVFHPDNDYRDYYLDPPAEIWRRFGLTASPQAERFEGCAVAALPASRIGQSPTQ